MIRALRIRYLELNLTKEVQNSYPGNCELLVKETWGEQAKWYTLVIPATQAGG
jgi:hypothetical protein